MLLGVELAEPADEPALATAPVDGGGAAGFGVGVELVGFVVDEPVDLDALDTVLVFLGVDELADPVDLEALDTVFFGVTLLAAAEPADFEALETDPVLFVEDEVVFGVDEVDGLLVVVVLAELADFDALETPLLFVVEEVVVFGCTTPSLLLVPIA